MAEPWSQTPHVRPRDLVWSIGGSIYLIRCCRFPNLLGTAAMFEGGMILVELSTIIAKLTSIDWTVSLLSVSPPKNGAQRRGRRDQLQTVGIASDPV